MCSFSFRLLPFIFVALKSSAAAKISVAYSLFRKPFTDNLFILEWLLSKTRENSLLNFYSEEPESYEPSRVQKTKNRNYRVSD
jgi:hypothetical protein